MIQQIQLEEAGKNLRAIIHSALEGDEVTITVDDEPVVKIVPIGKSLKNIGYIQKETFEEIEKGWR